MKNATTPDFAPDKRLVRQSFDKAAKTYDHAAVLQREIADRMLARLDYIKYQPHMILDAGSGTGYAARFLRQRYPQADLIELDLALGMLQYAREKEAETPRSFFKKTLDNLLSRPSTHYLGADLEAIPLADTSVDLIWSNVALQWCLIPDMAFSEFRRVLKPNGLLMFSTFGPDTLKELRRATYQIDQKHHVNQFIDMHDLGDALIRTGFTTPVMDMEHIVLTYQDVLSIMRDLKAIGAHNVMTGRRQGLTGKGFIQALTKNYEFFRTHEKLLPATYEVIYGHAWRGIPQKPKIDHTNGQPIQFHTKKPDTF